MRLYNRVAVVTGGGGGLGAGICHSLAREGAQVVVADVSPESAQKVAERITGLGRKALAVTTDVRSADQCRDLIDRTIETMGRLDVLVCCAGVGGFQHRGESSAALVIENISEQDWDLTIDVNLKGVFLCNRAAAPHFKRAGQGKIVNISSLAGRQGIPWLTHYSAAKAGVIALTQALARQLAPYEINVNAVCPGLVKTAMWDTGAQVLCQSDPAYEGLTPDGVFEAVVRDMIPMQKPQTPEGVGDVVAFLASDDAREITGQTINVDGGAIMN